MTILIAFFIESLFSVIGGSSLSHAPPNLPLYPPRIGEYHDSSRPITEGFPHASHHSPVLKQYFIPLQPVEGGKEVRPPSTNGNGLPYPVNKFLTFLMGELQKERNPVASPTEIASKCSSDVWCLISEGGIWQLVGYLEPAKCPQSKHCKIESYQVRKRVHIEKTI